MLNVQRQVDAGLLYARRSNLHEAQNELAKVRLDRRIGQLIKELPTAQGRRSTSCHPDTKSKTETLSELDIPKKTAHRLEQSASVPEEQSEAYIAETKEKGNEITYQPSRLTMS